MMPLSVFEFGASTTTQGCIFWFFSNFKFYLACRYSFWSERCEENDKAIRFWIWTKHDHAGMHFLNFFKFQILAGL
jgi:hypothetical protein